MANDTDVAASTNSSTIVIAIVVPLVLIIVLFALIILGFLLPRLNRMDALEKEQRLRTRQEELESNITSQCFYDWLTSQKEKSPGSFQTTDPICAICLEDFTEDAQVRGLRCCHAFHSHCLDEWFTRYNEYCPLCHRPIIPGSRTARLRARERSEPPAPVIILA